MSKTLHETLAHDLVRRIRSGEWPVGSSLPSEMDLSVQNGVSRQTLRRALQTLEAQGLITRRQGAPSKVISSTEPRVYSQDFNTLREVLRYPRNTYRENQFERYVECDLQLQKVLQAPVGSSWYHIGAIRKEEHSELPLAWTDIYIQHRFASVTKLKNHSHSMVFEQIESHFGVNIERATVDVSAEALSPQHATVLNAGPYSPCLVIVRRYFDSHGEPLEVTVTRHPEHRFSFSMELRNVSRSVIAT